MLVQFFLFLVLIVFLFIISRKITDSLYFLLYLFTKNRGLTIRLLTVLFLPGTIIHELSHFFAAIILFVPTGKLTVIPEIEDDHEVRAGKVEIAKADPFRWAIIGLAPILIGLIFIYFIGKLLLSNFSQPTTYNLFIRRSFSEGGQPTTIFLLFVVCYLLFAVSTAMFSSKKDLEPLIFAGPIVILLLVSLYFVGVRVFFEEKLVRSINQLVSELNLFLIVTNVLDYLVFLFLTLNLSLWQKILKRNLNA